VKVYKVVVVGSGGLRDVIAEFSSREKAERFVEQVKAIDKDARLEIVEARDTYPQPFKVILALAVLVVELTILMQMVRAVSQGGGSVV
jgi:hypothetical protein